MKAHSYRFWRASYLAHRLTFRFAGRLLPGLATPCVPGLSWSVGGFVPCIRVQNSHSDWYRISASAPKTHPRGIIHTTLLWYWSTISQRSQRSQRVSSKLQIGQNQPNNKPSRLRTIVQADIPPLADQTVASLGLDDKNGTKRKRGRLLYSMFLSVERCFVVFRRMEMSGSPRTSPT